MTNFVELTYENYISYNTFLVIEKEDNVHYFIPHKHDYIELYFVHSGKELKQLMG
jgi:hypothetical protein